MPKAPDNLLIIELQPSSEPKSKDFENPKDANLVAKKQADIMLEEMRRFTSISGQNIEARINSPDVFDRLTGVDHSGIVMSQLEDPTRKKLLKDYKGEQEYKIDVTLDNGSFFDKKEKILGNIEVTPENIDRLNFILRQATEEGIKAIGVFKKENENSEISPEQRQEQREQRRSIMIEKLSSELKNDGFSR